MVMQTVRVEKLPIIHWCWEHMRWELTAYVMLRLHGPAGIRRVGPVPAGAVVHAMIDDSGSEPNGTVTLEKIPAAREMH